jgi:putative glutamine amidotransferase
MRRPVIAVTGARARGRFMWWFSYIALRLFGAKPLRITPPMEAADVKGIDGLLIGGGDDIGAELYGGMPVPDVRIDPDRDRLELDALRAVLPRDMPVLGICRGAQILNVALGGTLNQDIHQVYLTAPRMRTVLPLKCVNVAADTHLREIIEMDHVVVNSLHQQSVKDLGRGLRVSGVDEYGIVQSIEDTRHPFRIGVQWHPEFLIYRKAHRRLFAAFVAACRKQVDGGSRARTRAAA